MDKKREQALAQFLDVFGIDTGAEIIMYVLKSERDTILLAKIMKHLSKAQTTIHKRRIRHMGIKYGKPLFHDSWDDVLALLESARTR